MNFKKRMLIILVGVALSLPFANAFASEINGAWIIVDHYYYSDDDTYEYSAQAGVLTNNASDSVFVKGIPNVTEGVELPHVPFVDGFFGEGTSYYGRHFYTPPPGGEWEGIYEFYIEGEGEPTVFRQVYPNSIKQWDFVQNVTVSGGIHPTITWEPIPGFDHGRYQVRFMLLDENGKPDRSTFIWQSQPFTDLNLESYTCTYEGNLIQEYGTIAISIEATENPYYPDDALRNRSVYYFIHNPYKRIAFKYVQHRIYEDGQELNLLAFNIVDGGNGVIDEIINNVELINPSGAQVNLSDFRYQLFHSGLPSYDCSNGKINWPETHDDLRNDAYYYSTIEDPLEVGNYLIRAYDKNGIGIYETEYYFNGQDFLPVVSSLTFKYRYDDLGNLIWEWDSSDDIFYLQDLSTSLRAMIHLYKADPVEGEPIYDELWVKLPTHMEAILIPNYIFELDTYDHVELAIQIRANDNHVRTFSNTIIPKVDKKKPKK